MLVWVTPVKPPAHDIIKRFDLFMGYIGLNILFRVNLKW